MCMLSLHKITPIAHAVVIHSFRHVDRNGFVLVLINSFHCSHTFFPPFFLTGGCALYGHSCYGGHGKRADMPRGEFQPIESGSPPTDKSYQNNINKELVIESNEMQSIDPI